MSLAQHYRTLGLRRGASSREVKGAYRTLVRQYHPDINPDEAAVEQFIKINDAYTALSEAAQSKKTTARARSRSSSEDGFGFESIRQKLEKIGLGNLDSEQPETSPTETSQAETSQRVSESVAESFSVRKAPEPVSADAEVRLSEQEESLKQEAYQQLKELLKQQKYPRAIALVEGLAHRMPADLEITQWQAIVYQRWGRRLIYEGQPSKARIYLKKALRTDPNNQSLWSEINQDFWQLANLGRPQGNVNDLESEGLF